MSGQQWGIIDEQSGKRGVIDQSWAFSTRPSAAKTNRVENRRWKLHGFWTWLCQGRSFASLRISLGGSDAARTAQDVLFRDWFWMRNALPSSTASGLGSARQIFEKI